MMVLFGLSMPGVAQAQADPTVVRVGAYINDVQQLDLQSHSYAVDMYIWFRWCGSFADVRVPELVRTLGPHPHL